MVDISTFCPSVLSLYMPSFWRFLFLLTAVLPQTALCRREHDQGTTTQTRADLEAAFAGAESSKMTFRLCGFFGGDASGVRSSTLPSFVAATSGIARASTFECLLRQLVVRARRRGNPSSAGQFQSNVERDGRRATRARSPRHYQLHQ